MSMMAQGCPSDDRLLAFAEGLLDEAKRVAVEKHLAQCADCSAVVSATFPDAPPSMPRKIGRYEVLGEIGRGGMGRVLRARDPSLDREVAIKSILPSALSPAAQGRFAREAAALGTLRHPNVIEVFDAGESDGAPYFVMEFVEGKDLDVWCSGRSVAEILKCLRGAGRGLAAAHAKGILHRDFKPSNVIVGPDGRAKVGDFGLATFGAGASVRTEGASVDSLTQTGALMGTLPYMARELLEGGKATERSDQFAFCVTMYEVLYGERPFSGRDVLSLTTAIRTGEIPPPPDDVDIPRRARRALERGLSPKADERFPSMKALLAELHPRRRATVAVAAGLATGGALVAVAATLATAAPSACRTFAARVSEVYDSRVRREIRRAFDESDRPYTKATSRSTLAGLDDYAARWANGAKESCQASQRGTLSDHALELRVQCLKHAAQGVEATVGLLAAPGSDDIERSGELIAALPELAVCTDDAALQHLIVLPASPTEAAEADALGPVLSEAHAHVLLNDFDAAWEILDDNAEALEAASYPPIRGRSFGLRARVLLARREFEAANEASLQAHQLAMEHRLDREASRAAIFLGRIAAQTGESADAQRWFDLALALAESADAPHLQAQALATTSTFYKESGQLERAVTAARRAVELIEHDDTYPATSRAEVLLAYSDRLLSRGESDDGLAQLQEAQEILVAMHGDTHPVAVDVQLSLQIRASRRGDYEGSYRHAREALRVTVALHGARSLQAAVVTGNFAISLRELGRYTEAAQQLAHADALLDDWPTQAPRFRVSILITLGAVMLGLDDNREARRVLDRAKALLGEGADSAQQAILIGGLLSVVERRDDNLAAAHVLAAGAHQSAVELYGEDHYRTADASTRLAEVELEEGNYAAARERLARARAVQDVNEADRGEATFLLARANDENPGASPEDRVRALELAREASRALKDKPAYRSRYREVAQWLARHPSAE